MTAYKAQGQTMNNVIVDLAACNGTKMPYVMLSRVKSLNGLLILCPFAPERIACHQSEDMRCETTQLIALQRLTTMETGTSEEGAMTQRLLTGTKFRGYMGRQNVAIVDNFGIDDAVYALQQAQTENLRLMGNHSDTKAPNKRTKHGTASDAARGVKRRKVT